MSSQSLSTIKPQQAPEIVPAGSNPLRYGRATDPVFGGTAWSEYWTVLRRRKLTVIAFAAAVLVLVTVASLLMTPRYETTGRISVSKPQADYLRLPEGTAEPSGDSTEYAMYLDAQAHVLESDTLLLQVAKDLKWLDPQAQNASKSGAQNENQQQAELLQLIHRRLQVTRVPRTPIIEITYSHPDPQLAAAFVNRLMRAYVNQNFKTKYESAMQVSNWLSGQMHDLKAKVETSQQKLVDYQRQKGILGIDDKQNIVTAKLDELNRELTVAQADRMQKQAIYENTISTDHELLPNVADNVVIQHMKEQQAEVSNLYAQATAQMGPAHPKVLELKNQLSQINSALREEINKLAARSKTAYQIALKREQMLRGALEAQKLQANQLNESAIEYNIMRHDLQSTQQLYDGLVQRIKEAGVSAGLRANNITIVDQARVPVFPAQPNLPLNLAGGLLLGCFGGTILAFVMDKLDRSLRTPQEVQVTTALPPLAVIPNIQARQQRELAASSTVAGASAMRGKTLELLTYFSPKSEFAEAYRALRTSLLLSSPQSRPKVILVTSALSYEGKTTTSLNCAIVLAQKGVRVLVIDADLRAPRVHRAMGISSGPGLSTLLAKPGEVEPVDAIVQSRQLANLFVLPAGPVPENPAELLESERMKTLLSQWRGQFDHIVIDTAPVLFASDTVALSVNADSVLLAVRSGHTPKEALVRARDVLLGVGAKVAGVVVNALDMHEPGGRYYGYSYTDSRYKVA